MNTKQFSEALSNVNDKYIIEALPSAETLQASENETARDTITATTNASTGSPAPKKLRTHLKVWRAIAIAACAILVVGGALAAWAAIDGASYKSADSYRDYEMSGTPAGNDAYSNAAYDGAYDGKNEITDEEMSFIPNQNASDTGGTSSLLPSEFGLKVIYTAYVSMETKEFDSSVKLIEELAKKNNAYFEMASVSNASAYYRSASYVVRIPAEQLDAFLEEVQTICTVTNMQKYAEDVSESYFDIETRLETAKTKLARLRELLAAASDMQDIITLENEISNTQYQIDNLTGTLNHYDSQITYSTVSIDLREVYKVTEENAPLTFGQHIVKAFKDGLAGFGNFMEGLLIFLAGNWIWLLILAAVIVIVILLITRRRRNRKEK